MKYISIVAGNKWCKIRDLLDTKLVQSHPDPQNPPDMFNGEKEK